jgi:hypothetical protein
VRARGNEHRAIFSDDLGRQRGRLKLGGLARLSGGVGYTAVAPAIRRVRQQIQRDKAWRRRIDAVGAQLSKMKM